MLQKTTLLLLCVLLNPPNLLAQDLRNRTEVMYPLGTVIIAKEPLPNRVYRSQKDKIIVSVTCFEKGTTNIVTSSSGTGFVSEVPGLIVSARHLIKDGDYDHVFTGIIVTEKEWIRFPISLVAKGEPGKYKDIMVLRVDPITMELAWAESIDVFDTNPYRLLLRTSEFADAKVDGKKVYISGFSSTVGGYFDENNQDVSFLMDLINFTFPAEVTASITNMPVNKTGTKKIFRLLDSAEPGFSGGKVMNEDGKVIGMTVAATTANNFIYVFSSQDIKQFFKNNRLK